MVENRHALYMRHAIELAREHAHAGEGGPFGAVIVADGAVLAEGWNRVLADNDPTAHAEIVAIRRATAARGKPTLEGAVLYSSCEPCPMCLGAIRWARLDALYFAADRRDAEAIGFADARFHAEQAGGAVTAALPTARMSSREASEMMRAWRHAGFRATY